MNRSRTLRPIVAAVFAAVVAFSGTIAVPGPAAAALPAWTGSVDIYRSGTFTTQKTWRWCTAADVQMMRNIVRHQADHSYAGQQRYWTYMRAHNRYAIPASDGIDPGGWTAGLRHYVSDRYRLVQSDTFSAALRRAVRALRRTSMPVAITVAHGNHAWILVGFSATADPAVTNSFTVTGVRVVGPLWGLQSRTYGYDMRPNTRLTVARFRSFFTSWHYPRIRMAWERRWITILPTAG